MAPVFIDFSRIPLELLSHEFLFPLGKPAFETRIQRKLTHPYGKTWPKVSKNDFRQGTGPSSNQIKATPGRTDGTSIYLNWPIQQINLCLFASFLIDRGKKEPVRKTDSEKFLFAPLFIRVKGERNDPLMSSGCAASAVLSASLTQFALSVRCGRGDLLQRRQDGDRRRPRSIGGGLGYQVHSIARRGAQRAKHTGIHYNI